MFVDYLYDQSNYIESKEEIPQGLLFVPCTDFVGYGCENRELAHGELAVIVEQISIENNMFLLKITKNFVQSVILEMSKVILSLSLKNKMEYFQEVK